MHQSIPPAPSSPPPGADPRALAIFFALDGKFPGVGTLELSNPPRWGRKTTATTTTEKHHLVPFCLLVFCILCLSIQIKYFFFFDMQGTVKKCISSSTSQNEVKCSTFMWKWFFILMQTKLISTRKVVHLASFWKWGFLELGSGLFANNWMAHP